MYCILVAGILAAGKSTSASGLRDYQVACQRFLERDASPARHRGHVVNDCYPEKEGRGLKGQSIKKIFIRKAG